MPNYIVQGSLSPPPKKKGKKEKKTDSSNILTTHRFNRKTQKPRFGKEKQRLEETVILAVPSGEGTYFINAAGSSPLQETCSDKDDLSTENLGEPITDPLTRRW